MIPVLIEATLRSMVVGMVVAVGLRVFRVHNVVAQKAAWALVLTASLAMPWLPRTVGQSHILPHTPGITLPAHPMTLLEELQARILAKNPSARMPQPNASAIPQGEAPLDKKSERSAPDASRTATKNEFGSAPAHGLQSAAPTEVMVYSSRFGDKSTVSPQPRRSAVSLSVAAWSLYLAIAAVLFLRLVIGLAAALRLWFTATKISPHSISGHFAAPGLRASRRVSSPLTIGSGILLPADYQTWDLEKLRIVIAHESSHIRQGDFYLQILAGVYASLVWFSPLGWWLKKELADLAEAISDRAGIDQAKTRTSYAQVLLEFAAAPRPAAVGVPMARSGSLSRRIERLLDDHAFRRAFAASRRALFSVLLVPIACFAATEMVRVQAASTPQSALPIRVSNTANLVTPVPAATLQTVAAQPQTEKFVANASAPDGMVTVSAQTEPDGSMSFDRTLSVAGEAQLTVATGAGNIHLTRSSGSQIHVHGQIHVSREGSQSKAREIAANPPIEQSGNVVRVGQQHDEHWEGISIDYEIEAPAGTLLGATSGSGNIVDEGVGQNARLETGSGDINASSLQGPFTVRTGSGNITAEQTGEGDVKAETGSGNIEIKDVHGSLRAQTGSGDIKTSGTPSAPWTLQTGSGNIDIWSGNSPLTLEGSSGSGSVTTDHEMLVQGSLDRHHIKGNLNGGGPLVRVQTGSGEIHVH